ncbi:MAG: hypothetical protein ABL983_07195 [Nitrospira sp.]
MPRSKVVAGQNNVASIPYYFLGDEALKCFEKIILLLIMDSSLRKSDCQLRVSQLRRYTTRSRATVFRALKRLEPDWLLRSTRPGKPSILKPGPRLLTYIKRVDHKGRRKWARNRASR